MTIAPQLSLTRAGGAAPPHERARQFFAEEFLSRSHPAARELREVEGVAMTESENDSCFVLLNKATFHVKHFDENPRIAAPFLTTFKKLAAISARRILDSSLRSE
jgi:hypothetical protein